MAKNLTPSSTHCKKDLLTKIGHAKYSQPTSSSYAISSASKTLAGAVLPQTKSTAALQGSVLSQTKSSTSTKKLAGSVLSQTKDKKD